MAIKQTDKANPTSAVRQDPEKPLVKSGIKTVATATGQDDPDRMEVINTVQGRLRSRFSDARDTAMRKVRKTNNTVGEETVQEGWFTRNKKEDAKVDQHVEMDKVLKKHGYKYGEKTSTKMGYHQTDRRYRHESGSYVKVFPHHLKDGKIAGPQAVTSHGTRHTDHRDLDRHLISKHGVKEEAMSENMEAMMNAITSNEPGEFKSALAAELQDRIVDRITARRDEVAKSMFNPPEPEEQETPED